MSLRFSYDAVPAYNAFWVGPEVECGGAGGGSSGLVGGREDWLARSAGSVAGLKRQPFGRARVGKPILLLAALVQQHDLIPIVVEAHRHRVALYGGGRTGVQGPECAQRPGSPALIFQHPTDHRTAGQLKPSSCRERTSGTSTPAVRFAWLAEVLSREELSTYRRGAGRSSWRSLDPAGWIYPCRQGRIQAGDNLPTTG